MTGHLGAEPEERTGSRRGYRNGSYERELTARVGTLQLEVPRDRRGTFQTKVFERYQRSEKALVLALMQMVVQGVSTRKVKKITDQLCGRRFSKSTVSELAKNLDEQVEAWAERELGECPFLICDGMQVKVRRQGAVRATTVLLAVGVTEKGQREILGLEVAFGETGQAWKRLLAQLKSRGLCGVEVATSDAHEGLRRAVTENFPGVIWQRCQAHFRRNVLDQTPAKLKAQVYEALDEILEASSSAKARTAFGRAENELEGKADTALAVLEAGFEEATTVLALKHLYTVACPGSDANGDSIILRSVTASSLAYASSSRVRSRKRPALCSKRSAVPKSTRRSPTSTWKLPAGALSVSCPRRTISTVISCRRRSESSSSVCPAAGAPGRTATARMCTPSSVSPSSTIWCASVRSPRRS